ncbi:MAG: glycerol dehydratase reactivase beta/small subunit family protein [Eubacterium sp.]|nr:glycerol dehydratase reactivase beta/small subunit family protein [Eubacterium sp.]
MISRRPSVFIYIHQADADFLREVLAGIEEENVSSEVFEREDADVNALAFDAAADSMMGSGIGISGVDVAMQMRGRRSGENVARLHMPSFSQCRTIGSNSARVMKKQGLRDLDPVSQG